MKKFLPLIIVLVLAAAGVGAWQLVKNNGSDNGAPAQTTKNNLETGAQFKGVDACTVLTEDVAKQLLGTDIKKGDISAGDISNDSISVSNCVYSTNYVLGTSASSIKAVSILVRAAKDQTGKSSNEAAFSTGKPANAQDVSGYGDKAFWSPSFGQLNILKNNNWYILSNGASKVTDKTLDDAKKLADLLIDKL